MNEEKRQPPTLQVEKVVWNVGVYFSLLVKALIQLRLVGLPKTVQRVPTMKKDLPRWWALRALVK